MGELGAWENASDLQMIWFRLLLLGNSEAAGLGRDYSELPPVHDEYDQKDLKVKTCGRQLDKPACSPRQESSTGHQEPNAYRCEVADAWQQEKGK